LKVVHSSLLCDMLENELQFRLSTGVDIVYFLVDDQILYLKIPSMNISTSSKKSTWRCGLRTSPFANARFDSSLASYETLS